MKIKLSKSQWDFIGKQAGWASTLPSRAELINAADAMSGLPPPAAPELSMDEKVKWITENSINGAGFAGYTPEKYIASLVQKFGQEAVDQALLNSEVKDAIYVKMPSQSKRDEARKAK
jgi:hypothetical protein